MKKTIKSLLAGLVIGLMAVPQYKVAFARSYGHFTETLPGPSAISDSVTEGSIYWNGTDWGVANMAPAATMGDSLSRAPYTAWQSLDVSTVTNNIAVTTMSVAMANTARVVGSTTLPIDWATAGRTIRLVQRGIYSTGVTPTWRWRVFLGTTVVLDTGALNAVGSQTNKPWSADALITVSTGGATGVVNAHYQIYVDSGTAPCTVVSYSTFTTNVSVELLGQRTINSTFLWGTASTSNSLIVDNQYYELKN